MFGVLTPTRAVRSKPKSQGLAHELRQHWQTADYTVPPRPDWPLALRRTRLVVAGLFVALAAAFIAWSVVEYHRFSVGVDFASRLQMAHLVANGQIDPFSSVFGYRYLQDHGEFDMVLIGEIYRLWQHPLLLLWLQDLMTVACCWVAFDWLCEVAARHHARGSITRVTVSFAALGALMLVSSPWTWWTIAFDLHFETVWGALFTILTVRDFLRGRRRAWLWALCTIAAGDVGTTYLVLVGLGLVLYGRSWLKPGLGLVAFGIGSGILLGAVNFNRAIGESGFGIALGLKREPTSALSVLQAMIAHPGRALTMLQGTRINARANLLSNGILGVLWPPTMVLVVGVLLESAISSVTEFSAPGFQNLIITLVMPVGTVAMLSSLARGRLLGTPRRIVALVVVLAANAVGWTVAWLPELGRTWLFVPPATAKTLDGVLAQVKPNDEVIMSASAMGRFAARKLIFSIDEMPKKFAVGSKRVWVIFVTGNARDPDPALQADAAMTQFANDHAVRLVTMKHGVLAFLWHPSAGTRELSLGTSYLRIHNTIGAWIIPGAAGRMVTAGNASDWHVSSTGRAGNIVDSARWQPLLPTSSYTRWTLWRGSYHASVQIEGAGGAELQVWDRSEHRLLAARRLPASTARTDYGVDFTVTGLAVPSATVGHGLWQTQVQQTPAGDAIAIRVVVGRQARTVSVYSVSIDRRK